MTHELYHSFIIVKRSFRFRIKSKSRFARFIRLYTQHVRSQRCSYSYFALRALYFILQHHVNAHSLSFTKPNHHKPFAHIRRSATPEATSAAYTISAASVPSRLFAHSCYSILESTKLNYFVITFIRKLRATHIILLIHYYS